MKSLIMRSSVMKSSGIKLVRKTTNEEGSVIIIVLLLLILLILIGISAMNISSVEMQVVANDQNRRIAFYAAESSIAYVMGNPNIYGAGNITPGAGKNFTYNVENFPEFEGLVEYFDSSAPGRGTGYEAGKFFAHRYKMINTGYGPGGTPKQIIEVGFYRIGF